ncbi:MAG TPA: IS200/IS605 family transposase [Anaerolineae bacterium]|nr:IS200/IS605 family transposase [Anaerolineae bacterium]
MSFWRAYYHLVWATEGRLPLIKPEIEARLYAYLIRKAAELEIYVYAMDGIEDHVHLIAAIPPKLAVAEAVKRLKGASSHYLNHDINLSYAFAWQRGYGLLTLGERQRPQAEAYVKAQKAHHQAQATNTWLERCADLDEGPTDNGIVVDYVPTVAKESNAVYLPDDEFPF